MRLLVTLVLISYLSCERDPLTIECSILPEGALVVSEIKGKQSDDTSPQWIELFNTLAQELTLDGFIILVSKTNGQGLVNIPIRRLGITVPALGYVVLGRVRDDTKPDYIAYGYSDDFPNDLYLNGIIEVWYCGKMIDRVVYYNLPEKGTLSFDGGEKNTYQSNDDQAFWCVDEIGTPGGQNKICAK